MNGVPAGEGAPKSIDPIWHIVSGLAQALNDARNQLAHLMHDSGNAPHRAFSKGLASTRQLGPSFQNGSSGQACVNSHGGVSVPRSKIPRCFSAPQSNGRGQRGEENEHGSPHTRNIHRSHAHGYCAFGRNTEFKERMHHNKGGVVRRIQSSNGVREGRDCSGAYGIKLQGGPGTCGIKVTPNGKSYTCTKDRGKTGIHLLAKMKNCNMNVDTDGEKFGPENPVKIHFSSPSKVRIPAGFRNRPAEVKRYCVGTQYANLLREEAHTLRERRIVEESKIMRNGWNKHS